MTQTVLLDVADGVATVTLNRPEASNTLDMAMGRELLATALRLEADRGVRAVLLTGAGKHFCFGGDVRGMATHGDAVSGYLNELTTNIHAGIKYNRWVIDRYYKDPAISRLDQELFAFASYNAGPAKVASLRKQAKAAGLNPNKWFNNVELIAAKRIGRETVTYVSNIYKYYLAYQLMARAQEDRQAARNASAPKAKSGRKAAPSTHRRPVT